MKFLSKYLPFKHNKSCHGGIFEHKDLPTILHSGNLSLVELNTKYIQPLKVVITTIIKQFLFFNLFFFIFIILFFPFVINHIKIKKFFFIPTIFIIKIFDESSRILVSIYQTQTIWCRKYCHQLKKSKQNK